MKMIRTAVIAALLVRASGLAQTLVGSTYTGPSLVVAPGQVVPVVVTGLKTVLPGGRASAQSIPLPTAIAGISVTLTQTPQYSRSLPIVSLEQFNQCATVANATSDCLVTAITVQIPFDISIPNPLIFSLTPQTATSVEILESGSVSKSFLVGVISDQIHVIQSCDLGSSTQGTCYPIVTHHDGTLVLQAPRSPGQPPLINSEAHPGEELVLYAFGLGAVSPTVAAGTASPSPAATVTTPVYLQFDYRPNASPSAPTLNSSLTLTAQPKFVGLTPGQLGLYQVNFIVPAAPKGTQVCGAPVESNLTVSITEADGRSFSGAPICVDTSSE